MVRYFRPESLQNALFVRDISVLEGLLTKNTINAKLTMEKYKKRGRKKTKIKILAHIIAITCFLVGVVFIHVVENTASRYLYFFNILIFRIVVLDTGLTLLGIAFFIEFYMTFRPIEVGEQ